MYPPCSAESEFKLCSLFSGIQGPSWVVTKTWQESYSHYGSWTSWPKACHHSYSRVLRVELPKYASCEDEEGNWGNNCGCQSFPEETDLRMTIRKILRSQGFHVKILPPGRQGPTRTNRLHWRQLLPPPWFGPQSDFFFSFKLEANCFAMLCWFLLYNSMNQL